MSKFHSDKVYVINLDTEAEQKFSTKAAALQYCLDNDIDSDIAVFDSKKEYKRWGILRAMEQRNEIFELKRQVPYLLIPAQYEETLIAGKRKTRIKKRRVEAPVIYRADFEYRLADGSLVTEDVKSKATRKLPEYIIKRKLMLHVYNIKLKEIL